MPIIYIAVSEGSRLKGNICRCGLRKYTERWYADYGLQVQDLPVIKRSTIDRCCSSDISRTLAFHQHGSLHTSVYKMIKRHLSQAAYLNVTSSFKRCTCSYSCEWRGIYVRPSVVCHGTNTRSRIHFDLFDNRSSVCPSVSPFDS
jgi:hypothetical protein